MKKFCDLTGKVALITGAATGVGAACAAELAAAGAQVMLSDIDAHACDKTAAALREKGLAVSSLAHDVSNEEHWQTAIRATLDAFAGLDVLVNNAGIYIGGLLVQNELTDLQTLNKVNTESIFLGTKYAAEAMQPGGAAGKGGSIINMSSVAGIVGVPGHSAYGASKGAVRLYTKHAAVEFARFGYGIRVNSVHPGLIETAMGRKVFDDFVDIGLAADDLEAREQVLQLIPAASLGQVQDIANIVRFLAADESAYCTGAEFVIDGGLSAA